MADWAGRSIQVVAQMFGRTSPLVMYRLCYNPTRPDWCRLEREGLINGSARAIPTLAWLESIRGLLGDDGYSRDRPTLIQPACASEEALAVVAEWYGTENGPNQFGSALVLPPVIEMCPRITVATGLQWAAPSLFSVEYLANHLPRLEE